MADFNIQPVGTQIRPVQGMSLGEMVNLARGVQEYQQAQQINPVQLQAAQQQLETARQAYGQAQQLNPIEVQRAGAELSRLVQLTPEELARAKAEAERAQTEARVSAGTETPRIGAATSQAQTAETQAQSTQMEFANKQVTAIAGRLTSLINNPMIVAAEQNPSSVPSTQLQNILRQYGREQANALGIPNERADQLIQPYLDQTNNPQGLRNFLKEKLQSTLDQGARATALGNVGISTQPAAPAVPSAVPGAPGAAPSAIPGMRLPYPVRSAAQPYVAEPTEANDQAAGQKYRTDLVNRQVSLPTDRRNVEETIKQATGLEGKLFFQSGGLAQDLERKLRMMIDSDAYKLLAKDLANLQISNLRALGQGGNTVAGMDLTKVASGDETIPPKVLIEIARRSQADMTNLDLQAQGAQAFAQRFGDNNMKAFQQAWNANADTKIFEAMNITRDVTDPQKRERELNRLFPDAQSRQNFLSKYRNLKKLSETGSL